MPMPWFIPIGFGLGYFGTHTAWLLRKVWGGGRRAETFALVALAWMPLLCWALVAITGLTE